MRPAWLLATFAVVVFALSAGTLAGRPGVVEAKPDFYADLDVHDPTLLDTGSGDCIGTVTWTGLHGGKPLWVQMRLDYQLASGAWQPVLGSLQVQKVHQNAGQFNVNFGADAAPTDSLRLTVSFIDRSGNFVVIKAPVLGTCN